MKRQNNCKRGAILALLLVLFSLFGLPAAAADERPSLLVGGMPFGVRFFTDGVLVVGYCDVESGGRAQNPAKEAGIRPGDCIIKIKEEPVSEAADLAGRIEKNGRVPLTLTVRRDDAERTVTLTPLPCDEDGRYRAGLWVRDTGAGIGTVTFIRPEDHAFGGLGHGICDGSGSVIPLSRGNVTGVILNGISRGTAGAPGELKGSFSADRTGTLLQNTPVGVFGVFATPPASPVGVLPIGYRDEIRSGPATLYCTVEGSAPCAYTVEIAEIDRSATGNKCFVVHVTDPALLEKTGGIVQGMSGSPIVQGGRLVGAVTHVLIGDPTTGYGVFIENMLAAMQKGTAADGSRSFIFTYQNIACVTAPGRHPSKRLCTARRPRRTDSAAPRSKSKRLPAPRPGGSLPAIRRRHPAISGVLPSARPRARRSAIRCRAAKCLLRQTLRPHLPRRRRRL